MQYAIGDQVIFCNTGTVLDGKQGEIVSNEPITWWDKTNKQRAPRPSHYQYRVRSKSSDHCYGMHEHQLQPNPNPIG